MTIQLAYAIITLCTVIITTFVAPYFKAKYTAAQIENAKEYAAWAIAFFEGAIKTSGAGPERFEAVVDYLVNVKGVKMTDAEVRGLIQSVYDGIKASLSPAQVPTV